MIGNRWIAAVLAAWLLSGCQAANRELVERELRMQEDRIYELQDYIHKYQAMLDQLHEENESLRRGVARDDAEPRRPSVVTPREPRDSAPPPLFQPPVVDPGVPTTPQFPSFPGREEMPLPDPLPGPSFDSETQLGSPEDVAKINLHQRLTQPTANGSPHGNILLVLEPRTDEGLLAKAAGEVSVMVVDPSKPDPAGRIARWDFNDEETTAAWRTSLLGHGMHFQLPWPAEVPQSDNLRLYVRLLGPDGQKHLAQRDIKLNGVAVNTPLRRPGMIASNAAPRRSNNTPDANQSSPPETAMRSAPPRIATRGEPEEPVETARRAPAWQPFR